MWINVDCARKLRLLRECTGWPSVSEWTNVNTPHVGRGAVYQVHELQAVLAAKWTDDIIIMSPDSTHGTVRIVQTALLIFHFQQRSTAAAVPIWEHPIFWLIQFFLMAFTIFSAILINSSSQVRYKDGYIFNYLVIILALVPPIFSLFFPSLPFLHFTKQYPAITVFRLRSVLFFTRSGETI